MRAGDLVTAEQCLREAVRADRRNAQHRLHWAMVLEDLALPGAAAEQLTEALGLDPRLSVAAEQLSSLAGRHALPRDVRFNPAGLRAALNHDNVSAELISELALAHLVGAGALRQPLEAGVREGWLETARSLCLRRTADALKAPLFLAVLHRSALKHPQVERLLTALRRVLLLEAPPQRFEDAALTRFVIALMHQCRANEHVWPAGPEEEALVAERLGNGRVLAGDASSAYTLLVLALYRSLQELLGASAGPEAADHVRPRELREAMRALLAEDADLHERAARVPVLGSIDDATSHKVADQYERNPYPRWTTVQVPSPAEMRRRFGEFFKPRDLAFMDRPFDMMVAGCGTGRQAVVAALALPNAHVTAIDLSAASIAYASKMAERRGARNVEFARADILSLAHQAPHFLSRFKVVTCTGVLHHMADPFEGWRRLIDCLAPGGLMLIGLYSAVARSNLAALRADPAHPGAGCSDAALRAYRAVLMDRAPGELGGELKQSADFYSTSEFRDLACHVSERHVTIAEIKEFLDRSGLEFRGFWLGPGHVSEFRKRYPDEPWPGRLERWARFEEENPRTFDAMYLFWCFKPDA